MKKTLEQKINELDEFCGGKFSVTHYAEGWQFCPYDENGIFTTSGKYYNTTDKDFAGLINKAYKIMLREKSKNI